MIFARTVRPDGTAENVSLDFETYIEAFIADRNNIPEVLVSFCKASVEPESIDADADGWHIAPRSYCEEAGLLQGSTWIEVVAACLDATPSAGGTKHLQEVQSCMQSA